MSNYVFIYYGGPKFSDSAQGAAYQDRWRSWVASIGEAVVNSGTPLKPGKVVSASGVSSDVRSDRVTGFAIVKAESLDAAVEMAQKCPHLEHGTMDVAEEFTM